MEMNKQNIYNYRMHAIIIIIMIIKTIKVIYTYIKVKPDEVFKRPYMGA